MQRAQITSDGVGRGQLVRGAQAKRKNWAFNLQAVGSPQGGGAPL